MLFVSVLLFLICSFADTFKDNCMYGELKTKVIKLSNYAPKSVSHISIDFFLFLIQVDLILSGFQKPLENIAEPFIFYCGYRHL